MRVAGLGFRAGASVQSLRDALGAAGGGLGLDALATLDEKADSPALLRLARELGLPVRMISRADLGRQATMTQSPRAMAIAGTGSLAEAAALAGAGKGAHLEGPRAKSGDGMATAAIARAHPQGEDGKP